jgi:hypothetical protein
MHIDEDGTDWKIRAHVPARPNVGNSKLGTEIPPTVEGFCSYSHMAAFAIRAALDTGEIKHSRSFPGRPSKTKDELMELHACLYMSQLTEEDIGNLYVACLKERDERIKNGEWDPHGEWSA